MKSVYSGLWRFKYKGKDSPAMRMIQYDEETGDCLLVEEHYPISHKAYFDELERVVKKR